MKLKIWGAIVPLLFLFGCATTTTQAPTTQPKYQLTLTGTIDGYKFDGIGIGSPAAHHDMTIKSDIAVNYFTMQSCHRSIQFTDIIPEDPWYVWSKDSKSFSWTYDEAPTIEDSGDCLLRFCAYSKTVGSAPVACAIVDFKNVKYSLPFENICNGADGMASGSALCHTQIGLIERVKFKSPVVIAPQIVDPTGKSAPYWISGQCVGKFLDVAQTLFEYQMPSDECVIIFMEKAQPHRRAKLTAIPYSTAIYPGATQ